MKKIILALVLLMGVSMYSQFESNLYSEVRLTVDPVVLAKEGNLNLKLEGSIHFNGHDHWRANAMLETLTGHNGYLGIEVGVGYSIPYHIGSWQFLIEPGVNIGAIHRPNMPTLITLDDKGNRVGTNEGYTAFSHSLNLRHQLKIADGFSLYIHNRLILRSDLHFENELTATPEAMPFYSIDNAVGFAIRPNEIRLGDFVNWTWDGISKIWKK